ncbi:GPI mannosyltransferase 1 [Trichomonascus vanleenenianus]|uniref:glycosylphosphatidylinositol-alpha 1,4 mannosyltransferase I n=1 Tax=Trichomonascus vanleenenianus TaxID=2268995 RepID=UPI003ECAE175
MDTAKATGKSSSGDTPLLQKRKKGYESIDRKASPIEPGKSSQKWFLSTKVIILASVVLRLAFFYWGLYQDTHMDLRFTDIDYFVFTDASRFVANGGSPYDRETYRYTPLLAWLLWPTNYWFSFGKFLFAAGDIVAGYLILRLFRIRGVPEQKAVLYSSIWLLNPMVCTISTRGSSEGLLGAMVISVVWAVYSKRFIAGGLLAGLSVHFKLYPIIYVPTILWATDSSPPCRLLPGPIGRFLNRDRMLFGVSSAALFLALHMSMYSVYGMEYVEHTYTYHLRRLDHRHNFSPYSTLLYMSSSPVASVLAEPQSFYSSVVKPILLKPSAWAFIPQLSLSGLILPLAFAKRDLIKTMFLQTVVFVTFNKVCTSQYFMWYMVLVPFYGPGFFGASRRRKSIVAFFVLLWVVAQALWINEAYKLEFLGESTFYPGLYVVTLLFFAVNCIGLGLFIQEM